MNLSAAFSLVRTHSLTSLVQEELERSILMGEILPGQALREAAIASRMGISRGPVREAFQALKERGLVVFEKNCGVSVRTLDGEEAAQIYQVRIPIEALIGQLAAQHFTAAAHALVQDLLARMREAVTARDAASYASLNLQFHDALARHAGNAALYDTYRRLVVQLKLFRSHTFRHSPDTIEVSLNEHAAIYDAIAAGQQARASELLREHSEDSLRRLRLALTHPVEK